MPQRRSVLNGIGIGDQDGCQAGVCCNPTRPKSEPKPATFSQLPKSVAFAVAFVKSYANATVFIVGFAVAFECYSESSEFRASEANTNPTTKLSTRRQLLHRKLRSESSSKSYHKCYSESYHSKSAAFFDSSSEGYDLCNSSSEGYNQCNSSNEGYEFIPIAAIECIYLSTALALMFPLLEPCHVSVNCRLSHATVIPLRLY